MSRVDVGALRAAVEGEGALAFAVYGVCDELEALRAEVAHLRGERAAVVAYLRASANAEHPVERGVPSLSPAGRGLLLLHADRIERGEHRREGEP
jgi:hypothetical protein